MTAPQNPPLMDAEREGLKLVAYITGLPRDLRWTPEFTRHVDGEAERIAALSHPAQDKAQPTPTDVEAIRAEARREALEEAAQVADIRARMASTVSKDAARALLVALPDAIRTLADTDQGRAG